MRGNWNHVEPNVTQECPEDNTSPFVYRQVAVWRNTGTVVHPEIAMEIAAWYHSPNDPGYTAFSHTGTIINSLIPEIEADLTKDCFFVSDKDELRALLNYVQTVQGIEPSRQELMSVVWHPKLSTWTVAARASAQSEWSYFEGTESELDDLLSIARDVITGG